MLDQVINARKFLEQAYQEMMNLKIDATPLNIQSAYRSYALLEQAMQNLDREIEELSQISEDKLEK